ncbi:unnamed protein product [Owenia fusiformis]|uniref:Uncharacterized protein n=1 Tax=Owenia fusiformis TaxID=6347 RepID=A0A8S4NMI9_OWEFU|nr:unnamed protein product [Owenia fusiformis]
MMTAILYRISFLVLLFELRECARTKRQSSLRVIRNTTIPCVQAEAMGLSIKRELTDVEKMAIFRRKGGYINPDYVSVDENGSNEFKDLVMMSERYKEEIKLSRKFDVLRDNLKLKDVLITDIQEFFTELQNVTNLLPTNLFQLIENKLGMAKEVIQSILELEKFATSPNNTELTEAREKFLEYLIETLSVGSDYVSPLDAGLGQTSYTSPTGDVTNIEYCLPRGSETEDGFLHLCTTCSATTILSEDKFPRYINEAVCSNYDRECMSAVDTSHGMCKQKVFSLNLLQKQSGMCILATAQGQTVLVDEWALYTQPIRVCCECTIDRRSFFARYVPPSTEPSPSTDEAKGAPKNPSPKDGL